MNDVNFMVGSISYLPDDDNAVKRIGAHNEQHAWVKSIKEQIGIDFLYCRVQSAWGGLAKSLVTAADEVIEVGAQPPGTNRNELLKRFYDSDYDWLVCMDDDRVFYPYYNGTAFFGELCTDSLKQMASEGCLIMCVAPNASPFKADCNAFPRKEDFWYIAKGSPNGFLQICFIPNLKKYGFKPIFFSDSSCIDGAPPEDVQFQIDWLLAKHPLLVNKNLIMKELTNDKTSSVFKNLEHRRACAAAHKEWETEYLKAKSPRNPKLWKKSGLNKHRNAGYSRAIPRTIHYEFKGLDLPKEK